MVTISDIAGSLGLDGSQFFDTLDRAEARVAQFESRLAAMSSSSRGLGAFSIGDTTAATAGLERVAAAETAVTTAAAPAMTATTGLLADIQAASVAGESWATTMLRDAQALVATGDATTILAQASSSSASTIQQLAGAMVEQQQAAQQSAAAMAASSQAATTASVALSAEAQAAEQVAGALAALAESGNGASANMTGFAGAVSADTAALAAATAEMEAFAGANAALTDVIASSTGATTASAEADAALINAQLLLADSETAVAQGAALASAANDYLTTTLTAENGSILTATANLEANAAANREAAAAATENETSTVGLSSRGYGMLALAVPLAGAAVVKMGMDFQTSLSQIQGFAGVTQQDMGRVSDFILKLASDTGASTKQIADAFYLAASAGLSVDDAMTVVDRSTRLAVADQTDARVVVDATTSALNSYHIQASQTASVQDVMTASVVAGKMHFSEYADQLGKTLPLAARAGVSLSQVGASVAEMTEKGLNAPAAFAALNQMLLSLEAPSATTVTELKNIGLSADDVRASIRDRGLLTTIDDLNQRTGGQIALLKDLFPRIQGLRGALADLGLSGSDYVQVQDRINASTNASGTAISTYSQTSAAAIRSFVEGAKVELTELGVDVANAIGWFLKLPAPIKDAALALPLIAAGAFALNTAWGVMAGIVPFLGESFAALAVNLTLVASAENAAAAGAAVLELASGGALTAVVLIGAAVVGTVVAIRSWISSNDDAAAAQKRLEDATTAATTALDKQAQTEISGGVPIQQKIDEYRAAQDAANTAASGATDKINALKTAISGMNDVYARGVGPINTAIQQLVQMGVLQQGQTITVSQLNDLLKQQTDAQQRDQASAASLANEITTLVFQQQGQATTAAAAAQHQADLTTQYNLGANSALSNAIATEKIDAAVKTASQSTSAGIAFQQAWTEANKLAALSGDDYTKAVSDLEEAEKNKDATISNGARLTLTLLEAVHQLTPATADLALAEARATQATDAWNAAQTKLQTAIQASATESKTFARDLATLGATGGPEFAAAYGTAAQQVIASMSQAASQSVDAWRQADLAVYRDIVNLGEQTTTEGRRVAQAQLDRDQLTANSAKATATEQIKDAQDYVSAVQSSTSQIEQLETQSASVRKQLARLPAEGEANGAGERLRTEQTLIDALDALEKRRLTTVGSVERAILDVAIAAAQQRLTIAEKGTADLVGQAQELESAHDAAARGTLQTDQNLFTAREKLQYLTDDERARGEDAYLQKVIDVDTQIEAIYAQLQTVTDPDVAFNLQKTIKGLETVRDTAQQAAAQINTMSTDVTKQEKKDTTAENAAAKAAIEPIKDQTTAINDQNAVIQAQTELLKQRNDVARGAGQEEKIVTQADVDLLHSYTQAALANADAVLQTAGVMSSAFRDASQTYLTDLANEQNAQQALNGIITQGEIDALHAATVAAQAHASALLNDTATALANWQDVVSTIDTTTGLSTKYSQAEIANAKAVYTTKHDLSSAAVTDADNARSREEAAGKQRDTQQSNAAAAEKTYASDRRTYMTEEADLTRTLTDRYTAFQADVAAGQIALGSAFDTAGAQQIASAHTATEGALQAYKVQVTVVEGLEKQLTQVMSEEDRKRVKDALDTAQATLADRKFTLDQDNKNEADATSKFEALQQRRVQAVSTAESQIRSAITASDSALTKLNADSLAAFVGISSAAEGTAQTIVTSAQTAYQAWQSAQQQVNADDIALTANLTADQAKVLQAIRDRDANTAADDQATYQKIEQNLSDYVQRVQQAQSGVRSAWQTSFDVASKLSTLTVQARSNGEAQWLQMESATTSEIANLEQQLTETTDEQEAQRLQAHIASDQAWLADVQQVIGMITALSAAQAQNVQAAAANAAIDAQAQANAADNAGSVMAGLAVATLSSADASKQATAAAKAHADALNETAQSVKKTADAEKQAAADTATLIANEKQLTDAINGVKTAAQLLEGQLSKPTTEELGKSADIAKVQDQLASLNDTLANDTAAQQHVASLQSTYDQAVRTGASLADIAKAKKALDAALASSGAAGQDAANTQKQVDTLTAQQTVLNADLAALKAHRDALDAQVQAQDAANTSLSAYQQQQNALNGTAQLTEANITSISKNWRGYANILHTSVVAAVTEQIKKQQEQTAELAKAAKAIDDTVKAANDAAAAAKDAASSIDLAANASKNASDANKQLGASADSAAGSITKQNNATKQQIINTSGMEDVLKQYIASLGDTRDRTGDVTLETNKNSDAMRGQQTDLQKLISGPGGQIDEINTLEKTTQDQQTYADLLLTGNAHQGYVQTQSDLHDTTGKLTDTKIAINDANKASTDFGTVLTGDVHTSYIGTQNDSLLLKNQLIIQQGVWSDTGDAAVAFGDRLQSDLDPLVSEATGEINALTSAIAALKAQLGAEQSAVAAGGGGIGGSSGGGGATVASYQHGGIKHGDGLAYLHDGEIVINPHEPVPGPNQGGLPAGAFNRQPISVVVDLRGSTVPQDPRTLQTLIQRGVKDGVNEALTRGAALGGVRIG